MKYMRYERREMPACSEGGETNSEDKKIPKERQSQPQTLGKDPINSEKEMRLTDKNQNITCGHHRDSSHFLIFIILDLLLVS